MIHRIGYKLILAVSLVVIVALCSLAYLSIHNAQTALLHSVEEANNQLSETIKASTKYYMLRNDRGDLHSTIDAIAQQQGIERIRVFNKEGEITFSSRKEEIDTIVDKAAEACYGCHAVGKPLERLPMSKRSRIFLSKDGVRELGIINPVYNEPSCSTSACHAHNPGQKVLGILDVTMSLAEVDSQLRDTGYEITSLAVLAILLISALLWFLVQRLVGRPVKELVEATQRVADGDLHYKIDVTSRDELGNLAKAFNKMTGKLSDAQRQIHQQDRLASLGRLSAGVAHEINNPLTGILTYASFLLKQHQQDASARADLEVIVRETKRCREIVKSLLDFARQTPAQKQPVDLNEVIQQARRILENQIALQNVKVHQNLAPDLPLVMGDPGQLQQVIINLIVNAIDALEDKGGEIHLSTDHVQDGKGSWSRAVVSDNGAGIEERNLGKIFEPFFSTKGVKGTGLGLSVVWGIVEEHGGKISVTSKIGEGTTFTILLPQKKLDRERR